jgi:hypothetical protein
VRSTMPIAVWATVVAGSTVTNERSLIPSRATVRKAAKSAAAEGPYEGIPTPVYGLQEVHHLS